ncbi:hypothetical protein QN239_17890 [Mycolicibacterium sp. Y3]
MGTLTRWITASAFVAAVGTSLLAPAATHQPDVMATCPNQGILVGKQQVGAYTDNCDLVVTPPPAIGAAPSAGAIIACRGITGCLSDFVNNPGWVKVPQVDTRPRQSP